MFMSNIICIFIVYFKHLPTVLSITRTIYLHFFEFLTPISDTIRPASRYEIMQWIVDTMCLTKPFTYSTYSIWVIVTKNRIP